MVNKPNVLVAGFPKCGSTFLYHLLKQHPDVFIPKIKEINYFNKDHFFITNPEIINPRYFKSKAWYYHFFNTNKKIKIDFSILSALDVGSAKRVKKELGDIKILFIIRNKEDFKNSVLKFGKKEGGFYGNVEDYADFEYYINIYKQIFSKILVVSLEDLNKNPKKELDKITKFLNLKKHKFNLNVPKHETKIYKMGGLQYLKRRTYFALVRIFYKFVSLTVTARIKAQGEK